GYAPGAYLGRVTDLILKQSGTAIHLDRVYETDMAEGLKVMALEGHGVAFLPYSAVKKELRARRHGRPGDDHGRSRLSGETRRQGVAQGHGAGALDLSGGPSRPKIAIYK